MLISAINVLWWKMKNLVDFFCDFYQHEAPSCMECSDIDMHGYSAKSTTCWKPLVVLEKIDFARSAYGCD